MKKLIFAILVGLTLILSVAYASDVDSDGIEDGIDVCNNNNMRVGMKGYWAFEEGAGSDAANSISTSHTGTISAGATWTTGKIGSALSFSGSNSKVTLVTDGNIRPVQPIVEAWVKPSSLTTGSIRVILDGDYADSTRGYLLLQNTDDTLCFVVRNNGGGYPYQIACSTTVMDTSSFYYVVGTYDLSNVKIYVNGVLEDTEPWTLAVSYGTNPVVIGQYYAHPNLGYDFIGIIDEVTIADGIFGMITQADITKHYQSGAGIHYCSFYKIASQAQIQFELQDETDVTTEGQTGVKDVFVKNSNGDVIGKFTVDFVSIIQNINAPALQIDSSIVLGKAFMHHSDAYPLTITSPQILVPKLADPSYVCYHCPLLGIPNPTFDDISQACTGITYPSCSTTNIAGQDYWVMDNQGGGSGPGGSGVPEFSDIAYILAAVLGAGGFFLVRRKRN